MGEKKNVIRIIIFIWYIEFLYRTISISNETTTLWAFPLNINYQITVDFGKIYAIVHTSGSVSTMVFFFFISLCDYTLTYSYIVMDKQLNRYESAYCTDVRVQVHVCIRRTRIEMA